MKKTTYQIPEIRDENDNIIQPGTYGKNSPLCNETNDGVLDYINNNLEYLKSTHDSIDNTYATKDELKSASEESAAALNKKISDDSSAITTSRLTATTTTTASLTATGETSVPTANTGNKSKTIANTEFVQNSIASLVDSAPEALNTLKELATALGNDANFAATVAEKIGEKISKSGDTITGPILYDKTPNDSTELVNKSYADTTAKAQADIAVSNAHHYIQRNTAYNVGDVLTSPNLPYGTIIVVTQAGTTGADEPDWNTIKNNIGGVVSDGTAQFKTVTLYEDTEYHDYSTLTVTNGTIMEPANTYWIKRGRWIYVNISGILTNDSTSQVYISGLPAPANRVNASMFSNRSTRCIGLFSIDNGKFATIPTGEIEQLYASFAYMI